GADLHHHHAVLAQVGDDVVTARQIDLVVDEIALERARSVLKDRHGSLPPGVPPSGGPRPWPAPPGAGRRQARARPAAARRASAGTRSGSPRHGGTRPWRPRGRGRAGTGRRSGSACRTSSPPASTTGSA